MTHTNSHLQTIITQSFGHNPETPNTATQTMANPEDESFTLSDMEYFRLTDLPPDVIDTVLFFLPQAAIHALSQTCKLLHWQITSSPYVWQLLYKKTFGTDPTPFSFSKWPELYKLRRGAKLYTWGALVGGRLGFSTRDVPGEHLIRQGFQIGICHPTEVPGLEDFVIADVSAGGFSIQLLTAQGDIYSLGNWHNGHRGPGPDQPDYNPLLANSSNRGAPHVLFSPFMPGRRGGVIIGGHAPPNNFVPDILPIGPRIMPIGPRQGPVALPIPRTEPPITSNDRATSTQDKKESNKFLSKQTTINQDDTIKFVSLSSGRTHFIALDNAGNLWSWDDPRTNCGVNIIFKDSDDGRDLVSKGHKVLKCLAGWGSSVAFLYGYGLVYWKKRQNVKDADQHSALAFHSTIPGTGDVNGDHRVVDFIGGDSFIVYLTAEGKLYRNDMVGEESYELVKFGEALKERALSVKPQFTRLSGNFNTFACFSNEDVVLMGTKNSDEPQIIDELQGKNCINIAVGDYHLLALLEDGTLLSWGFESNACGCLGLGKEPVDAIQEGSSRRVLKPTVVQTEGKVLSIGAAGWHSCAIISE